MLLRAHGNYHSRANDMTFPFLSANASCFADDVR